ncbi:MAG: hypothetical protein O3B86_01835, partial [Planctomycetota bacterium]|nr:hypothetical protein [Planctomycetota bacterium]
AVAYIATPLKPVTGRAVTLPIHDIRILENKYSIIECDELMTECLKIRQHRQNAYCNAKKCGITVDS